MSPDNEKEKGTTTEVATTKLPAESPEMATLRDLLYRYKERIAAVLPRVLTVERLLQLTMAAAGRDRKLMRCSPVSILRSVMVCGQLGLDPTGVLGQAYLVPFFNKHTGRQEAQFIPGYKGLLDLARRSERVLGMEARVVYEGEPFEYEEGIAKVLRHKPALKGLPDVNAVMGAYAIMRLRDDAVPMTEWMTREQIEVIRTRSRAGESGPWVTDWPQMARKTVLRRILNYAPLSPEVQKAMAVEDRFEQGETDVSDIITMPVLDEGGNGGMEGTKSDRLAQRLKDAKAAVPTGVATGGEPMAQAETSAQTPLELSAEEAAEVARREQAEAERQAGKGPKP